MKQFLFTLVIGLFMEVGAHAQIKKAEKITPAPGISYEIQHDIDEFSTDQQYEYQYSPLSINMKSLMAGTEGSYIKMSSEVKESCGAWQPGVTPGWEARICDYWDVVMVNWVPTFVYLGHQVQVREAPVIAP